MESAINYQNKTFGKRIRGDVHSLTNPFIPLKSSPVVLERCKFMRILKGVVKQFGSHFKIMQNKKCISFNVVPIGQYGYLNKHIQIQYCVNIDTMTQNVTKQTSFNFSTTLF